MRAGEVSNSIQKKQNNIVAIVNRFLENLYICCGRYIVNAKSMLGVLSMPEFDKGDVYKRQIQTVADLAGKPVIAASNTLNYRGHHGMALTKKSCDACAQCYLNITGCVCPIVDCSKSLVNGQCGGAKNGKCEVDPNKDCAWEKIYQRLAKQGRLEEFLNQPVQVREDVYKRQVR